VVNALEAKESQKNQPQPKRKTMNSKVLGRIYLLLALAAFGCAGAQVTQQRSAAPVSATPPTHAFVYPFAVDASDVTLNQGIFQRAYRNMSGENQNAQQLEIAHQTAQNICVQVAANLTQKGISTTCLQRGVPPTGSNILVLDGQFTDINEGNRLRRMVIGLGAGASTLDSVVQVVQKTDEGSHELLDFSTHADSGRMPGAGVTGPAGAAAGGAAAAASLGANVAAGGVKSYTSSTGFLVDKTTDQIVELVVAYYNRQGWLSGARPE
jgi:Domain of unknown function (DUF4410)